MGQNGSLQMGEFEPQLVPLPDSGSFTAANMPVPIATIDPATSFASDLVGRIVLNPTAAFPVNGSLDMSAPNLPLSAKPLSIDGMYSVAANRRGTVTFAPQSSDQQAGSFVFYAISPTKFVWFSNANHDSTPVLTVFEQ